MPVLSDAKQCRGSTLADALEAAGIPLEAPKVETGDFGVRVYHKNAADAAAVAAAIAAHDPLAPAAPDALADGAWAVARRFWKITDAQWDAATAVQRDKELRDVTRAMLRYQYAQRLDS